MVIKGKFHYMYKTNDVYKDIAEDVESRFDTASYDEQISLSKNNSKKLWM